MNNKESIAELKDIYVNALEFIDNRTECAFDTAIRAIEKQQIIKDKLKWLKTFNEYATISVKEVINAFEDCEIRYDN